MSLGKRRQGREIALQFLYSLRDQVGDLHRGLADFLEHFKLPGKVPDANFNPEEEHFPEEAKQFAGALCRGVLEHIDQIDRTLVEISANWSLERMARVDLALLRLGTYELLFSPNVPTSVILNEAIEIGKRYGTKETPAFVNGILDRVAKTYRS